MVANKSLYFFLAIIGGMHADIDSSDKLETRGQGLKPERKKTAIGMYGSRIIVVYPLPYFNSFLDRKSVV